MSNGSYGTLLTQEFVFDFMSNISLISERSYQGKLENLNYQAFTKTRPTNAKKEHLAWLISTARLRSNGFGGNVSYESLSQVKQTMSVHNFQAGAEFEENEFTDKDGHGIDGASEWAAQIGADIAYFPQREVVSLLLHGETGLCYDGKAMFATDHPNHPLVASAGTYSNLFAGAAYDITTASSTLDQALDIMSTIKKNITAIKMPNGVDPRFLTVAGILCPPALTGRLTQLTQSKFIASASNGAGGGTSDVEAYIRQQGYGPVLEMAELGASQSYDIENADTGVVTTVTGSDSAFYILTKEVAQSEIGAMMWLEREPVMVQAFNRFNNGGAEYAEKRIMRWLAQGRAGAAFGLPYHIFKVRP